MARTALRVLPPGALVLVALAVAAATLPTPASWIERLYSGQAYLVAQNIFTRLTDLVGFAWLDVLIVATAAGLAVWWWRGLRRERGNRAGLARAAGRQIVLTAAGERLRALPRGDGRGRRPGAQRRGDLVGPGR